MSIDIADDRYSEVDTSTLENPWATRCFVSVAVRVEGESGRATLVVKSSGGVQSAILSAVFGSSGMENEYDYIMAWRCTCPTDHRVTYASVEDLPDSKGYHDACPTCGASPIEVL